MKNALVLTSVLALGLAACGEADPDDTMNGVEEKTAEMAEGYAEETAEAATSGDVLASVLASDRRGDAAMRDVARHPAETLEFFGVEPSDTVVEVWPGAGWYTDILAPYLASGGGKLYAAGFDPEADSERFQTALRKFSDKYLGDPDTYGDVEMTVLSRGKAEVAPAGSADVVLTFRNVHNWEMGGWASEAFAAFYDALKPGGTLGVVDHRLPEDAEKALEKSSGYMKVSTVRQLAEDAGFVFDASSEVNANPNDDTKHPFGVWTLPPNSRTTDRDGNAPEGFDASKYLAIGESDRMTLRFKKPIEPAEALLE